MDRRRTRAAVAWRGIEEAMGEEPMRSTLRELADTGHEVRITILSKVAR